MTDWWQTFFDGEYVRLWEGAEPAEKTEREVVGLWQVLGLKGGSKVLDAPCGYGRISRALADRGVQVLGVDLAADLLTEAERRRGGLSFSQLRYLRHDLRSPIEESDFDAAVNIFSSLGYGTEADDIAILSTLRAAVRPGGLVFVETTHRDGVAVGLSRTRRFANRLPDGTLLVEEPRLDPVAGRVETTWYWSGPRGSGQKAASFRVYTATEVVRLLAAAGLQLRSIHNGCSPDPFATPGSPTAERLGVLAARE